MSKYANIYLVASIIGSMFIFSAISFVYVEHKISNSLSAKIYEKSLQKN